MGTAVRVLGSLNAGLTVAHVVVVVRGTATGDVTHGTEPRTLGAFASARVIRIARVLRFEASGSGSSGSYLNMFGGSAGVGLTLFDDSLDVLAYYRRTELQYASVNPAFSAQDSVDGTIVLFPSSTLMFSFQGEGIGGDDVNLFSLLGMLVWRPRL